jgi:hypothetical protein
MERPFKKHCANKQTGLSADDVSAQLVDGTETLILAHGTNTAPAIGFASPNEDTGIYHGGGGDSLDFTVGGIRKASIDAVSVNTHNSAVFKSTSGAVGAPAYTFS